MYLIGFKGVRTNRKTQLERESAMDVNAAALLDRLKDRV